MNRYYYHPDNYHFTIDSEWCKADEVDIRIRELEELCSSKIISCSDGQIEQLAEIVGEEKDARIRELEKENEEYHCRYCEARMAENVKMCKALEEIKQLLESDCKLSTIRKTLHRIVTEALKEGENDNR